MKKLVIFALLIALTFNVYAQEEKEMKKGWSFGLLPTATFSVDNGFQAGAFGDVYNYGGGSTYRIIPFGPTGPLYPMSIIME